MLEGLFLNLLLLLFQKLILPLVHYFTSLVGASIICGEVAMVQEKQKEMHLSKLTQVLLLASSLGLVSLSLGLVSLSLDLILVFKVIVFLRLLFSRRHLHLFAVIFHHNFNCLYTFLLISWRRPEQPQRLEQLARSESQVK